MLGAPQTDQDGRPICAEINARASTTCRVRQMVEALQYPAMSTQAAAEWSKLQDQKHTLRQIEQAVARLGDRTAPPCSKADAAKLAERIASFIVRLEQDVIEEQEELAEGFPPGVSPVDCNGKLLSPDLLAFEESLERHFQELKLIVMPLKSQLSDRARVAEILAGQRRPKRNEVEPLRVVLADLDAHLRPQTRGRDARLIEQRMREGCARTVVTVAVEPEGLMLLDRYRARIEHAIERKLAQLRRRDR